MASTCAIFTLLAVLVRSNPLEARQGRQRYFCGRNDIAAKQCIDEGGPSFVSAFCSSYLPITTVTRQSTLTLSTPITLFTTVTDASSIATADAITTTETSIQSTGVTQTTTDATNFITTSTSTSYTSTTFTTEVSTDTVYTCPTASAAAATTEADVAPLMVNRIVAGPTPSCLASYLDQRVNPVSRGCRCQFLPTPTSTQVVFDAPTTVVTTTVAGSTTTPVITQVISTTDTATSLQPATLTTASVTTELAVFTSTITSVTTVTSPSPVPSAFNIARLTSPPAIQPNATNGTITPITNGTTVLSYARIGQPVGASAPLMAFSAVSNVSNSTAAVFGLGPQGQVILPDFTSNSTNGSTSYVFAGRAIPDFLPFLYLQANEDVSEAQVPVCSTCDGVLDCQYPGTTGSVFAICFSGQYLALGPAGSFSGADGGCEVVTLGLSPVSSAFGQTWGRRRGVRLS